MFLLIIIAIISIVILKPLYLMKIEGSSLEPEIYAGAYVVVLRFWQLFSLRKGKYLIANYGQNHKVMYIKRIAALPGDKIELEIDSQIKSWFISPNHIFLLGTTMASFDSRVLGPVPYKNIRG